MRVSFVFTKLLVWFLVTIILSREEDEYSCPQSLDGDVLWPETKPPTCARSTPLCINKNMEIWSRCCDVANNWQDPPQCDYFQETVRSPCPDYYTTNLIENTCIFALKDSTYPPTCPYEETLPFFKYILDIDPAWLPVWMPVFRDTGEYGLDLLRWVEPTLAYKTAYTECIEDVCDNYRFSEPLKDKNCVIFHNTSYVEAVSCDEKHTAICAYQSLPYRIKSFCSQNFPPPNVCMQSDYSTKSKCFCEGSMNLTSSRVKAEFLQPYQNLLYPALSNETCYIGLERHLDGTYIWSNSNAVINYTSWAKDTAFGESYKYGVISSNGWMLMPTETESKCVLYQEDPPKQDSDITLEYNEQIEKFTVTVTNPRGWVSFENGSAPMVFCFTDAANHEIISTMEAAITSVSVNYATYSFEPHGHGPGNYWCEAFLYPDVVAKSSNKYLLRYTDSYTEEYAVIMKTYYAKGSNPLTETNMKLFRDRLADQITVSPISDFIIRIFKIIDIDEANAEITINFHAVNSASSEPLKLYSILRGFMEQNIEEFTFINVFGVDSCVGIQTSDSSNTATWSITNIHEVAVKPREGYCLSSDGSIMTRRCYGDYVDGARWSELAEPCIIQQSTNVTVNLTNIIDLNNPKEYIDQVAEVVEEYASLTPLDVHLISKFLEQLASSDDIDIYTVVAIIDRLMNVSDEVLREAQIEFNATDRILYYTDKLMINSKFIGELTEHNFFLISYYIKTSNLSGVILKSYSDVYFTIYKLFNLFDLDEIKVIDNLSVGVVLSQALMDHIYMTQDCNPRIIVIAYKNSKFFNEEMITNNATGMIMGILLPDLGEEFSGEIFTVYNNSNIRSDFNCSYWNYDLGVEKGSWKIDAQRIDGESAVFCTYDRLSHLALVQKTEINITYQLQIILSSPNDLTEKLANASALLTKYYSEFQPVDVMLLSSLLYQATQTTDDNLDLIADIVNKVIDIPFDVLERSQMMYNATGKILTYFDEILQQFSSSTVIQRDNFYAAVQFLNEEIVYGLTLANCASKCDFKLLLEEPDESKILLIENLDTGMIISRELLDQLFNVSVNEYVPKMVITLFLDDTLFMEDYSTSKFTTRVVGVLLPNFDEPLNGDIRVLYDVNMNVTSNYTCSVYCNDSNDTTYEKGFWNSENPPARIDSFLRCQFWKPNYFGLVYKLLNLTMILESMLQSELPMEVVLKETDSIASSYYNYLQAIDIFLIAQMFAKVTEVSDVVLETCLNIVSNVMRISRHTLISSQELYGATNMILYYSNKVAQNYNNAKVIYKDNVILIVSLLSESSVFGIALENCEVQCQITVLYENATDYQNIDSIIDFDTELNISQNLIDQLLYYEEDTYIPKLVLTVYYNDALFNEQTDAKKTGKIFGVYLPNFHRVLSHEIKLYSNISVEKPANDYDCALWEMHEDEAGTFRGKWVYQSRARGSARLACNFYQQSYYTFLEGITVYENITDALINISNLTASFSEKLYKTEDVSYYYSEFKPVDVSLLPDILSQCDQLADDGLDRLTVIINNILRIPSATLIESQNQYKALNQILYDIINIATFLESHQHSNLTDQFALVVCPINSTTTNSAVATTGSLRCASNFEENNLADISNAIVVTVLSDDLLNQAMASQAKSKFIVTLFLNDIFFSNDDASNASVVLGVSIPKLNTTLDGDVTAFFNSSSYQSNYYCAYRDFHNLWNTAEPTARTGVYTRCEFRIATYYYLALAEDGTNVTESLKEINEGNLKPSEKLRQTLQIIMLYVPYFGAIDVFYVAQIMSHVDQVDIVDLQLVANITNSIMKISRGILVESQGKYNATDWILYQVDRIVELFNGTTEIVLENMALIIASNITGITIVDAELGCTVNVLRENLDSMSVGDDKMFNTAVILDEELQKQLSSTSRIFATIYFTSALFNEGYNGSHSNIGQIIGIDIPSVEDLQLPLKLYYYTESNNTDLCVFWNYNVTEGNMEKGLWLGDKIPSQASSVYLCEWTRMAHFALLVDDKNVTNDLENILNSNLPTKEKLMKVLGITLNVPNKLLPVDIYLIAEILNYAIEEVGSDEMNLTAHIISRLFYIPRDVLRESQTTYYATDKILHSIDEMAKLMDRLDGGFIVYEHFVLAIYDLKGTNTSGLTLEYCESTMCRISVLENSVNLTQLGDNEHLETAMALSDELLEQVRQSAAEAKLVVTIFFSDVLFNEKSSIDMKTSMICGVLLPGFEDSLAGNIYLMFNAASRSGYDSSCAYWDYKVQEHESIVKGSWKTEDYPRAKERFRICEFDHVTHFALLLANDNSSYIDANVFYILDIITAVNCVLSLVGILGILLTAALFERWRKNTGNQILLNFAISISIKIVMLYVSVGVSENHAHGVMCSVTGAILHYAMLSEFCWMLIIAILQFKRFVEVLGGPPKYVLLKACVCGWVFPALPVMLILLIDTDNYSEGNVGLCYPSGLGLYLGIWLPLIIIVAINFVIFIFIIYNVFHKKTETRDLVNHEILFQWRLALLLFSMLGLTWLFGFVSQIPGAYMFVYLFCFTATLQGFVMFLFFIVFNQSTRFLYAQAIKLWLYSRGYKVQ